MIGELRALAGVELDGCGAAGIYFLFWGGKLEYVGKSVNVFHRIGQHWTNMQRKAKGLEPDLHGAAVDVYVYFDEVRFRPVPKDELDLEEMKAIQRYRPRLNVKMNRTPLMHASQIASQEWFQKLTKIADEAEGPVAKPKAKGERRFVPSMKPKKISPQRRRFEFGDLLNV